MHKLIHRGLLAALLCGAATAAFAEAEVATAVELEAESTVDALIVTARRRSESVQEVPVAISVLFGQTDPIKVAQRGILAPQLSAPEFSDTNFSYDLTATYKVTPDVLAYATIAKTFKTGGVNQNGLPTDAAGNPILSAGVIKPEDVTHLEGGLKTEFWAGRATLNLSVFRKDIDDFQATVTNGQFGVLRGYLANAEQVRSQGVEFDFSVRAFEGLSAYVNGAYTDAKYVKFVDAPCPPELSGGTTVGAGQTPSAPGTPGGLSPANCDISGGRLPGVSKWAFSYGGEASRPVTFRGREGIGYIGVEASYRSDFSSNASPSIYTNIKGYSLANFRAGFRTDEGFDIFGWVRNAFDEEYFEQLALGPGNTGLIVGQPGDERTWGLTLKGEFWTASGASGGRRPGVAAYSHSMVPGGLLVTS